MSTVLSKLQHPAVAVNYLALFYKWKYTFVTHFKKFKSLIGTNGFEAECREVWKT